MVISSDGDKKRAGGSGEGRTGRRKVKKENKKSQKVKKISVKGCVGSIKIVILQADYIQL